MASRRIFIAFDISEDARRFVAEYIGVLRSRFADVRVGWERTEKLHFTLKFLGQVDEQLIPQVENAIAWLRGRHSSFNTELSGTGVFPSIREPRILWLGVGCEREEIMSVASDIDIAVEHVGFARDP